MTAPFFPLRQPPDSGQALALPGGLQPGPSLRAVSALSKPMFPRLSKDTDPYSHGRAPACAWHMVGAKQIWPRLSLSPKRGGVPAGASGGPTPRAMGRDGWPCSRADARKDPDARRGTPRGLPPLRRAAVGIFIICPPTSLLPATAPTHHWKSHLPTLSPQGLCGLMAGPKGGSGPQPISTLATLSPLGGPGPSHQMSLRTLVT